MHKMPRVWVEYLELLMSQQKLTHTRHVFDRCLCSLPITQHDRIWTLYLVSSCIPGVKHIATTHTFAWRSLIVHEPTTSSFPPTHMYVLGASPHLLSSSFGISYVCVLNISLCVSWHTAVFFRHAAMFAPGTPQIVAHSCHSSWGMQWCLQTACAVSE